VAQALRDTDDATRRQVIDRIEAAFQPYVQGAQVRFVAACWSIGASAG
jgi:hypothetical protein